LFKLPPLSYIGGIILKKDKTTYRKIKKIKNSMDKNNKIIKSKKPIQLKECPRIKHSIDMPLKKATMKCVFRRKHKRECIMHPSLIIYLNENNIKYDFWNKFKCVI
jgi:hypothetical protein